MKIHVLTSRIVKGEACNSHILAVPRNDSVIALVSSALRSFRCAQTSTPCHCCGKMCMRAVCLHGMMMHLKLVRHVAKATCLQPL